MSDFLGRVQRPGSTAIRTPSRAAITAPPWPRASPWGAQPGTRISRVPAAIPRRFPSVRHDSVQHYGNRGQLLALKRRADCIPGARALLAFRAATTARVFGFPTSCRRRAIQRALPVRWRPTTFVATKKLSARLAQDLACVIVERDGRRGLSSGSRVLRAAADGLDQHKIVLI